MLICGEILLSIIKQPSYEKDVALLLVRKVVKSNLMANCSDASASHFNDHHLKMIDTSIIAAGA